MEAYQACTGWSNILDYVKTRVGDLPGYKEKTIEYYDKTNRKAAIKRIKRIINQQRKHSQISKPNQSSSMLSTINNKDMRYATKQTPEQRIKQKLAIAAANVSSSTDDEMIMGPKEDDGEGTSGLEMQRPANNTPQAPNSSENEMNVDVKQTKPQRVDKKRRRERRKDERAAYAAHTTMCKKALVMMDKIGSLITKLDSSDSD